MKQTYIQSLLAISREVFRHPLRSMNLQKSIPSILTGVILLLKGALLILNGLLSIAFRVALFLAFPITIPLVAFIYYNAVNSEWKRLERQSELTQAEKTELGI